MATELQTEHGIVRVPTGTWHVDPAHSSVEFEVKDQKVPVKLLRHEEEDHVTVTLGELRG
jgi:hypothetical protein